MQVSKFVSVLIRFHWLLIDNNFDLPFGFVARKFSSGPKVIRKKLRAAYNKYKYLLWPKRAVEFPTVESPVVESPTVESPDVESPVVESPAVESPDIKTPAVGTDFTCMKCSTVIPYRKNFLKHMRQHHGEKFIIYYCPYCPAKRNYVYNMRDHIIEKHNRTMKVAVVEKFGKAKIRTEKSS